MNGLLLRRREMMLAAQPTPPIVGFQEGTFEAISVDSNGVLTLGSFTSLKVYHIPFNENIQVNAGDVVEFSLNGNYGSLSGAFCDGGFHLTGNINSFQLKVYSNKKPSVNTTYTATATSDFTAQYWGMACRSAYDYSGRQIKPEIKINGVRII